MSLATGIYGVGLRESKYLNQVINSCIDYPSYWIKKFQHSKEGNILPEKLHLCSLFRVRKYILSKKYI